MTPRNCYCGGPEETLYGHRYGEGLYCRRKAPATPPMKRMRLELAQFGAEVLLVGDRFEEGGRYVQLVVEEHARAVWDAADYLNAFDRLEREWLARFGPR